MSDVPDGYRMSEVGVIPEEWEVETLGEVVDFLDGKRRPIKDSDRAKMRGQYPYYGASGIIDYVNDYIFDENLILLGEDGENIISRNSRLVFQISGKVWVNNHAHVLKPKPGTDIIFLTEYLESLNYELFNTGTAQPKLNQKVCSSIPVLSPPLPEQRAIASALSDVDALITALEQLITKKRNIKQGTMQQLITGKKRLPGFEGEWGVKRLGEIAEIATGNTPPTNDLNNYGNEFLFVSPADLGRSKYIINSDKKLSKKGFNISRKFPKNSILFTCIGSTIGKSGIAPIVLTSNQQINAIFPNDSYSTDYVFYTLNHLAYRIKSLASEQAVPIINKSTFEAIQTPFPPLPEQQAIAQILSDMDTEIESLEQKRDKYKAIKQGMMQELLTGKRRLLA
jgi:type I restriction enzyme S subunit